MPFTGKWAWNVPVSPPYTDSNSSHPSVHTTYYGDWATDLYAAAGTAVRLEVPYATGDLSYSWISVSDGSCGHRTVISVRVDGVTVGSVYYEHLANAVTSGAITNGMVVGYVHDWGGCNPGPHVHIEFKNTSNYACWVDHGQPGASTLNQGDDLGVLGSTNTGPKQACTSMPNVSNDGLLWKLRNSDSSGSADSQFYYGSSTDTPVPGNWDGVGTTTLGITRSDSNGLLWKLRNADGGGPATNSFYYGSSTDIPVVGDWDGNGTVTIGIVRRDYSVGQLLWKLRNSNSAGSAEYSFYYGSVNDTPVVGDWDGNGTTTIGIVRDDSGQWLWKLRNSNSAGPVNTQFDYGVSSADPVTGDWDGNGTVTVGVARNDGSGQLLWELRNSNSTGTADYQFHYGTSTDTPVIGDWNGDGTDTIGIVR